jgi:hypothetical protein
MNLQTNMLPQSTTPQVIKKKLFHTWIPGTRAALFNGKQEQVSKGIPVCIQEAKRNPAMRDQ